MADLLSRAILESNRRTAYVVADSVLAAHENTSAATELTARLQNLATTVLLASVSRTAENIPRSKL